MARILVVDDEIGIRELLSEILREEGHDVLLAENAAAARDQRMTLRPDLVLLDIWMPDMDGISLLKEWAADGHLTMPVVMMSGHATIDTAVEATSIGAVGFLEKPIGMQKLLVSVRSALMQGQRAAVGGLSLASFPRSAPLRELRRRLELVASGNRAILLRSAPGGFVELAARTLLASGKGWLDLSSDSQPLTLEMLEGISGGVVYAEEIGRLVRLQQKNLLFAAERLERHNLRLVAGSEQDAAQLGALGWDEAMLARVFDGRLALPALADIRDEIPDIATHVLTQLVESGEVSPRRLSTAAQNALRQHAWPGGFIELKRAMKSIALSALDSEIGADDVRHIVLSGAEDGARSGAPSFPSGIMDLPLREAREAFERQYFELLIAREGGNMTHLAEKSGLERTHLYRKLKDLGLRTGRRGEEEQ